VVIVVPGLQAKRVLIASPCHAVELGKPLQEIQKYRHLIIESADGQVNFTRSKNPLLSGILVDDVAQMEAHA